ncbi:hypothetical protein TruAng_003205 [Truncatella angustata]|nr:hypothetical protein TruAng_003205 [Truncatella angustata]
MGIFSKKKEEEDTSRQALFGNKSVTKAAAVNPYANANDSYSQPPQTGAQSSYQRYQTASYGGLPGGPQAAAGGLPNGPRGGAPPTRNPSTASESAPPPPYAAPSSGYGSDRHGAPAGYGSNRYGDEKKRPGGYGGLGPASNEPDDTARDDLFGGARQRAQQKQQEPSDDYGASGSGATGGESYGGYGSRRELTAEEQEEEEVAGIRRQIKETKLASANSAENSERIANQAGTYARLGAQHERLNYTEGLLDKASMSTREAESSTKKLKHLNRSMFAVHVNNPFLVLGGFCSSESKKANLLPCNQTSGKKTRELEQSILEQHRADRDLREATRKAGWQANDHMERGFKEIEAARSTDKWKKSSAAEKNKYSFEDDSEDDEAEGRIDSAMERTAQHVGTLNSVARLMQKEIDSQDQLIGRLGEKSDAVNDQAKLNTERLRRIH